MIIIRPPNEATLAEGSIHFFFFLSPSSPYKSTQVHINGKNTSFRCVSMSRAASLTTLSDVWPNQIQRLEFHPIARGYVVSWDLIEAIYTKNCTLERSPSNYNNTIISHNITRILQLLRTRDSYNNIKLSKNIKLYHHRKQVDLQIYIVYLWYSFIKHDTNWNNIYYQQSPSVSRHTIHCLLWHSFINMPSNSI